MIEYRPDALVSFAAAGVNQRVAWRGGTFREATGSSYATPLISGVLTRLIQARPDLAPFELMSLLKHAARQQQSGWQAPWQHDCQKTATTSTGDATA